jgi:hypothetical protein
VVERRDGIEPGQRRSVRPLFLQHIRRRGSGGRQGSHRISAETSSATASASIPGTCGQISQVHPVTTGSSKRDWQIDHRQDSGEMIAPTSNSKEKSMVAVTSSASGERSSSSGGMSASDQAGQAVLTTATRLASPSNKDRAVATIIKHMFINLVFHRFPMSLPGRLVRFPLSLPCRLLVPFACAIEEHGFSRTRTRW